MIEYFYPDTSIFDIDAGIKQLTWGQVGTSRRIIPRIWVVCTVVFYAASLCIIQLQKDDKMSDEYKTMFEVTS